MVVPMKLLLALSSLLVVYALPASEARALHSRSGAMCSTKNDSIEAVLPADINTRGGRPLLAPIAPNPTFVAISVGVQNYTCLPNGTWTGFGAVTELFDISCIPASAQGAFTTYVADLWAVAPAEMTAQELISVTGMLSTPSALGQHYFILDPNNATSGQLFAKWDFRAGTRLRNDANIANAYAVAYKTGDVPSPDDSARDADWLSLAPALVDGKPDGQLADQVFRLHSNGGNPPTSCTPGSPVLSVKSILNFWFYGGAWNYTIG